MKKKLIISLLFVVLFICLTFAQGDEPKCIYGNCKDGIGSFLHSNGGIYSGKWESGKFHGQGALMATSGNKQVGEWENGFPNEFSTLIYKTGETYSGTWYYGRRNNHT